VRHYEGCDSKGRGQSGAVPSKTHANRNGTIVYRKVATGAQGIGIDSPLPPVPLPRVDLQSSPLLEDETRQPAAEQTAVRVSMYLLSAGLERSAYGRI
jgi:hypothetical protein